MLICNEMQEYSKILPPEPISQFRFLPHTKSANLGKQERNTNNTEYLLAIRRSPAHAQTKSATLKKPPPDAQGLIRRQLNYLPRLIGINDSFHHTMSTGIYHLRPHSTLQSNHMGNKYRTHPVRTTEKTELSCDIVALCATNNSAAL